MVTYREVGSVFKALADPVRRRILDRLAVKGLPVREIAARFPVSRPAISKHLRVLRQAGLVRVERLGRERVYTLVAGRPALAGDWLTALEAGRPVEESRSLPAPRAPGRKGSIAELAPGVRELREADDWRSW